jgi:hypothetical protein
LENKMATNKIANKANPKANPKAKKAVSTAWNIGEKMTLHSCRVGGKDYKSVWQAFKALGMGEKSGVSRGRHITFRAKLKDKGVGGKLSFTDPRPKGKTYEFTLTKPAMPK